LLSHNTKFIFLRPFPESNWLLNFTLLHFRLGVQIENLNFVRIRIEWLIGTKFKMKKNLYLPARQFLCPEWLWELWYFLSCALGYLQLSLAFFPMQSF
jgi:hypothetical protein